MIDFGSDEEFIKNYQKLKSSRKMSELYHCNKTSILNHARKIGYDTSNNKVSKLPIDEKDNIIKLYEQEHSLKAVADQYNCSTTAVSCFLKKIGYKFDNNYHKKITILTKEQFIAEYNNLKSAQKMGEKYGCSATAVLNYAKRLDYDVNSNKEYKLTDEDKEYILNNYYIKTSTELAQFFNVSRGMITKIWYDAGLIGKINNNTQTTEKDITGQHFGKWTVLYKTTKRNTAGIIYWHCRCECGIEKDVLGSSLRNGLSLSCGAHANVSKGNEKIKELLTQANIAFEMEKTFSSCKDVKMLPFDFYVNNSYLIEYDGEQHFNPIGSNDLFDYDYTVYHDQIKNQWCKEHAIPLIRIPYTHFKNLILDDLLIETSNFIV